MSPIDEKIKNYLEPKAEKIVSKIEKTPMEKFFVFFLILITISAVGLGYLQFIKNIQGPLYPSLLEHKRGQLIDEYNKLFQTSEEEVIAQLKNQDSDLDGLDDWSELNIYGTSPYLSDTDSDKISDKDELLKGEDPNCPQGQVCGALNINETAALPESTYSPSEVLNTLKEGDMDKLMQYQQELIAGTKTLKDIGIDNPELQKMFDEMKNVGAVSQEGVATDEEKKQALDNLKNMTPAQLREELIIRGMDKATVDQLDDETLKQIFDQIINKYE
ncbi:MAG: hypothetical protein NTZ49_02725 [Candidatus Parcubacteria bacterium]|nr:hypothetical protein [Candidatus Parcubacteria bacterium]